MNIWQLALQLVYVTNFKLYCKLAVKLINIFEIFFFQPKIIFFKCISKRREYIKVFTIIYISIISSTTYFDSFNISSISYFSSKICLFIFPLSTPQSYAIQTQISLVYINIYIN